VSGAAEPEKIDKAMLVSFVFWHVGFGEVQGLSAGSFQRIALF
jgi:hypothetical protein